MQPATILIVDDEATIREVVRKYLERDGFNVLEAESGTAALACLETEAPDLIVLDIMLPGIDGFEIARSIRNPQEHGYLSVGDDIPIIMLTARTEEIDRVFGFELGADDYVVKPFSPRELVMRVKAILRRKAPHRIGQQERLILGGLCLDPNMRTIMLGDKTTSLAAKEFELLWFLARHPGQVFTRAQILDHVWGYEFYGDESTVTVHIRRLREKIERDPSQPTYIQTVWGVGYKLDAPETT